MIPRVPFSCWKIDMSMLESLEQESARDRIAFGFTCIPVFHLSSGKSSPLNARAPAGDFDKEQRESCMVKLRAILSEYLH
jgi:hypothetical protein